MIQPPNWASTLSWVVRSTFYLCSQDSMSECTCALVPLCAAPGCGDRAALWRAPVSRGGPVLTHQSPRISSLSPSWHFHLEKEKSLSTNIPWASWLGLPKRRDCSLTACQQHPSAKRMFGQTAYAFFLAQSILMFALGWPLAALFTAIWAWYDWAGQY